MDVLLGSGSTTGDMANVHRPLEGRDRIARACLRRTCQNGVVLPAAFALRESDHGKLSVDWVECRYVPNQERNPAASFARLTKRLTLRPNERVAVVSVEVVRSCTSGIKALNAIEDSHDTNQCHAAIIGMSFPHDAEDLVLQSKLAEAVSELLP